MGLDVYCRLVAGVNLKDHYCKVKVGEQVTKYNEDTGQPYQKTVTKTVHNLGTAELSEDEWAAAKDNASLGGMEFFTVCDDGPDVLGVEIACTNSHRSNNTDVVSVPGDEIDSAFAKAKGLLKQYGLESEVKLLMVPRISY